MNRPDLNDFDVEYNDWSDPSINKKATYIDYEEYQKALEEYIDYLEAKDREWIKLVTELNNYIKIQNA